MPKMRAMVISEPHARFRLEELETPEPGPDEVRLRVQACGVCHSDAVTVEGLFPGIAYPRVPGHEVIGVIDALGPGIEGWQAGERIGVGWFGGSCGYCRNCRRNAAFACENKQSTTGVTRDGGYATHMLALTSALVRVPASLDSVESAPLLCAGVTTFNALRNSGARPGDLVAVHGVGGLGHLGIQFAARQGFRTVALNRGRDKEALARSLGAHAYIDSAAEDPADALQARAILSTVTSGGAMQTVVGGLGPNGTMMVIGAAGQFTIPPPGAGGCGGRGAIRARAWGEERRTLAIVRHLSDERACQQPARGADETFGVASFAPAARSTAEQITLRADHTDLTVCHLRRG